MEESKYSQDLKSLIGFGLINRPYESIYAFVSRLIRENLLTKTDAYAILPRRWLIEAFDGQNLRDHLSSPLSEFCDSAVDGELKTRGHPWNPFSWTSCLSGRLRGCVKCFAVGYHSYAYQSDLMQRCPVHDEELVDTCPRCGTALILVAPSLAIRALQCPAGCDLMEGTHVGLMDECSNAVDAKLGAHLAVVKRLQTVCQFLADPLFIRYPPFRFDEQHKRSPGLTGAVIDALRAVCTDMPEPLDYHRNRNVRWEVRIKRIDRLIPEGLPEARRVEVRRSCHRGTFHTYLPVLRESDVVRQLEGASGDAPARLQTLGANTWPIIDAAPYLFLNSELEQLHALLCSRGGRGAACQYSFCLESLLEHVSKRFERMQGESNDWGGADISEWFEGLVRLPNGLWRVTAMVRSTETARIDWRDLTQYRSLFFLRQQWEEM